ncbi:MAG: SMC family ATPase [Candidatus Methanomethyliaceae archaeon]
MRMQIERLELRNFEGYKRAEIDFAKGLNIITGRNSTGKTTILEALLFALYGGGPGIEKKLLVSKLQDVAGSMSVKLVANMHGKHVEILREGRLVGREGESRRFRTEKLSLKIDGKEVPIHSEEELNKKVGELAGMGVKMFTTLIYARQGELTNILEPKREDMDLILGISLMKELAEQLDSAKKSLEKYEGKDAKTMLEMYMQQLPKTLSQIDQIKGQVNRLTGEVQELEKTVSKAKSKELRDLIQLIEKRDNLTEGIRENETTLASILAERGATNTEELNKLASEAARKEEDLKSEIQQLTKEEERINSVYTEISSKLSKADAYLKSAGVSTVEELEQKIASITQEHAQIGVNLKTEEAKFNLIEKSRNALMGKVTSLSDEVKSHEELLAKGLANCPTCGQEVNPATLGQIINDKKSKLEQLNKKTIEIEGEYQRLKAKVDALKSKLMQLSSRISHMRQVHDELTALLAGKTVEELEKEKNEAQKDLEGIRENIKEQNAQLAKIRAEKGTLQNTIAKIQSLEEEKKKLEKELFECLEGIRANLQALAFPFQPEDADLKAKIAEQLPLSVEELSKKETDLHEKREQLTRLKANLEALQKEEQETKKKIGELQKRLGKVKVCEQLLEKIKGGIESLRERRLKRIADEALRVYETLTDQRIYKAFRINRDDYAVEVFPSRLEGYIPAKRTGGGHQTLIALAVRVALLHVLNQRSLIILDEPTYGVDSENLPQLMSYFSEAAKKLEQTIVVSHYGLGEEEAANIIKVSLAPDGSSTTSKHNF